MLPSPSQDRAPRPPRWRMALLSGLAIVAVAGSTVLLPSLERVQAQSQLLPPGAPSSFADLVERVKPSVVSIQVTSQGPKIARGPQDPRGQDPRGRPGPGPRDPGARPPSPFPDENPLEEFFKRFGREGIPRPAQAQGSGFVISADGYVVTNNHVVDNASKVQVMFDQHNKYDAEVVGTDERTDLALLKIKGNGKTFPFVKFASDTPRVGEWVVAVGNPFGLGGTVTAGIVSAHGRDIAPGPYDYMQIDAAVNKGNSGGPSFNLAGDVVGVNTAIYSPTGVSVGIAFAIPARTASEVITQLKTGSPVKRGWLGVRIQNVDEDTAASLGLSEAKGALVADVTSPSPAAEAGVKSGDTILSVNGAKIADSRDLARQIAAFSPGTKVDLRLLRGQKEQNIAVTLGLLPTTQEVAKQGPGTQPSQPTELGQLGLTVAPATGPDAEGVVVTDVDNSADAAQKIRTGDVILEISSTPVRGPEDLISGVRDANKLQRRAVLLRVRSGNETRFVAVQLKRS
jgi:serine protease Do